MKIDSSTIGMESARCYQMASVTYRRFTLTKYQEDLTKGLQTSVGPGQEELEETDEGTKEASKETAKETGYQPMISEWQDRFSVAGRYSGIRTSPGSSLNQIRQQCIRYIFDMLFRSRRDRIPMREWTAQDQHSLYTAQNNNASSAGQPIQTLIATATTMSLKSVTWQMESETTSFTSTGTVKTADGREIQFNMEIFMSREFEQYFEAELDLASISFCDPLVINLDTGIANLTDQTFYFDIDADGELDEISMLNGASGYLALDKNGDGTINDGSELFGTGSGNGFADLAAYDEDGNGWIDENDAIWDKLKIWTRDADGNDVLYTLAEKGVGAICLHNVSTDYTLNSQTGGTQGAIRNTGIFLYENGSAGTIQHVDVVKYNRLS